MGDGVYKSTDAGRTWTNVGLTETGRIAKIVAHPTNPDVAYVCATGRITGPQQERGVYRTMDGGKTWEQVLFVDKNTGCSGLSMDAKNPRKLIAGTWQAEMHPWAMFSGGPGSGIFVSSDAGSTWKRAESPGLPTGNLGKIDVAIAPSDSNRVYALIQTADQGSVWRSDDGGASWRAVNWDRALIGRAGYYINIEVSSDNRDDVYVADSSFWGSVDGGETFRQLAPALMRAHHFDAERAAEHHRRFRLRVDVALRGMKPAELIADRNRTRRRSLGFNCAWSFRLKLHIALAR